MKHPALAAIITLFFLSAAVQASPGKEQTEISQQEAVAITQHSYPGRILNVKRNGGVYKVKVLADNGDVRIIKVDAQSGKVINGH